MYFTNFVAAYYCYYKWGFRFLNSYQILSNIAGTLTSWCPSSWINDFFFIQNWSCEFENGSTNQLRILPSSSFLLTLCINYVRKKIVTENSWQPCILSDSAVERRNCVSLVGHVLYWNKWTDYWNKRALNFYHSLGCVCLEKFRSYRLNGERLLDLAGKKSML